MTNKIKRILLVILTSLVTTSMWGYKIVIPADPSGVNGTVTSSPADNATSGATVTLTVTPNSGYFLSTLKVVAYSEAGRADTRTETLPVVNLISTSGSSGTYTFRLRQPGVSKDSSNIFEGISIVRFDDDLNGAMRGAVPGDVIFFAHRSFQKSLREGTEFETPLSDGISPKQGLDKNGPAAILKSASKLETRKFRNGTLLNLKFHPKVLEGEHGVDKLKSLIQTFFDLEGMHVQYNVVSTETLKDAQKNPENYKDLVIRIAGFSAYFIELYKELQDDIIKRNESMGI